MTNHETNSGDNDGFEDHERISDEDVFRQIEENFTCEERVSAEIPPKDIVAMKKFMVEFKVVDSENIALDELEDIWYRLARDPSIGKDYAYMPTILKDYAYILMGYRTKLHFSEFPLTLHKNDFMKHALDLETRKFSPRLWVIEKHATPNLQALGIKREDIINHSFGDTEGRIKAAEFTRFLGWLVGQGFMRALPAKMAEFKKTNNLDSITLTNVASVATIEVMDTLDGLRSLKNRYIQQYPAETSSIQRYREIVSAMEGIYNLCDSLLLGIPKEK